SRETKFSSSKSSSSIENSRQDSDDITYDDWQFHAIGGPKPGWRFTLRTGGAFLEGSLIFLEGSLIKEEFCACRLSGRIGRIDAKFIVRQRFIRMNVLKGPLAAKGLYELTDPRKMKVFNLLLWKKVVQPYFEPHLSWAAISYE